MSAVGDAFGILSDLSVNAIIFIGCISFLTFLMWNNSLQTVLMTVGGVDIKAVYLPIGLLVYFLFIHASNQ